MIRYAHIHNAWVICTQDEFSEKTNVQVLVPVGHKGYPGFEIQDAKIKGTIIWGHDDKRATNKEMLDNIIKELKRIELSLEKEIDQNIENNIITEKRSGNFALCEGCGSLLIAPYDGQPYWCIDCSIERERS